MNLIDADIDLSAIDDCNVYVLGQKAGRQVMALLRHRYDKLRLKINESKSGCQRVSPKISGIRSLGGSERRGEAQSVKPSAGNVQATSP